MNVLVDLLTQIPWFVWVTVAVFGIPKLHSIIMSLRPVHKDPQRLFDGPQKTIGRRNSGNRCEHKHPFWFRCKGGAEEADHVYPHSKGGATTVGNLQYLCKPHNRRKSAWIPTRTYIWRLERRRRTYFPEGADMKVRWKLNDIAPAALPPRRLAGRNQNAGVDASFYVGFDHLEENGNDGG